MNIERFEDEAALSAALATRVLAAIVATPAIVLGLPTGRTPLGLYRELRDRSRGDRIPWSQVRTFNLDEYVGLGPAHPQSYRYFMQQNLFDHINVVPANTHVPDGRALDFEAHCRQYEQLIKEAGSIDLQILGVGTDGHIAFNEPGSSLGSRTRLKTLASETIRDNARFFGGEDKVPRLAVTMGVGTILASRRCLFLAFGPRKAIAVRDTVEGPITAQVTASALQLHREVIGVFDEAAARLLVRRDYYAEVERAQCLLESGKLRELGIGAQ